MPDGAHELHLPDRAAVDQIVNTFRTGSYSMKQVFADTAVYCMGE